MRVQKVKGKDALIRILFKAARMLFYELANKFLRRKVRLIRDTYSQKAHQ